MAGARSVASPRTKLRAGAVGQHRRPAPPVHCGDGERVGDASDTGSLGFRVCQRHLPYIRFPGRPHRRTAPVPDGQVLSVNDDGLDFDPARWETTGRGRIGGGVLTTACLTTTRQASTGQQLSELLPRLSADKAVDVVWTTHSARSAAVLHASHPELWRRLIHL